MVERGESCTDVLTQVAAVRAALAAVALGLLERSMPTAPNSPDREEFLVAVERLIRL